MNLYLVKPEAEKYAVTECSAHNLQTKKISEGILEASTLPNNLSELCFPFWILIDVNEINYQLAAKAIDTTANWFCKSIENESINDNWYLHWITFTENGFASDFSKADKFKTLLKRRISRVSKLANSDYPPCDQKVRGLFITESKQSHKIYLSREAIFFGQRRMKDDPAAPSRSYLKIEEAFSIFNRFPAAEEIVADLGAAPGGWTWAALKRGSTVYAIDNGPLKKGPLNHNNVHHIRQDAYTWQPPNTVDWLFCDMVDQPFKVFKRIETWFSKKWCKNAIINFKYGHNDPLKILELLYSPKGLLPYTNYIRCRHLYHDRDEITMLAEIKP